MLCNVIRIIEGHHLTSLLPKWRYSVMHTLMQVGDTPVVKYDLALWPLSPCTPKILSSIPWI